MLVKLTGGAGCRMRRHLRECNVAVAWVVPVRLPNEARELLHRPCVSRALLRYFAVDRMAWLSDANGHQRPVIHILRRARRAIASFLLEGGMACAVARLHEVQAVPRITVARALARHRGCVDVAMVAVAVLFRAVMRHPRGRFTVLVMRHVAALYVSARLPTALAA